MVRGSGCATPSGAAAGLDGARRTTPGRSGGVLSGRWSDRRGSMGRNGALADARRQRTVMSCSRSPRPDPPDASGSWLDGTLLGGGLVAAGFVLAFLTLDDLARRRGW